MLSWSDGVTSDPRTVRGAACPQTRMPTSSLIPSAIRSGQRRVLSARRCCRIGSCSIMFVTGSVSVGRCTTPLQSALAQHGNHRGPCSSFLSDRVQRRHSSSNSRTAAVQWSRRSLRTTRFSYHWRPCQRPARASAPAGKQSSPSFTTAGVASIDLRRPTS